jgi:uncharacterized OB-fold protein
MSDDFENHVPLPKDTPAFNCARCGVVSLNPRAICEIQGKVRKSDWCGSPSIKTEGTCKSLLNNIRYKCKKCGRISITPGLLCEPEKMPLPGESKTK